VANIYLVLARMNIHKFYSSHLISKSLPMNLRTKNKAFLPICLHLLNVVQRRHRESEHFQYVVQLYIGRGRNQFSCIYKPQKLSHDTMKAPLRAPAAGYIRRGTLAAQRLFVVYVCCFVLYSQPGLNTLNFLMRVSFQFLWRW